MTDLYDAIVIGAGQAGPALADKFGAAGLRTAIVERHLLGGTCVNVGCIPTKTLVGSARIANYARRAAEFGVDVGEIHVDMARVKARKDDVAGTSAAGVAAWIDGMENVDLIRGHARFTGSQSIDVDGRQLRADRIFVNVGARARVPDMPGLSSIDFMTNSSMMDVDFLPEHLLIVGGSYIGLEFAQMYRRFGARVTVVEMQDRLVAREDEDVSDAIRDILEAEDVIVRLKAECLSFERGPAGGLRMHIDCADDATPIDGSHVLLAIGRVPNTHDLGLEHAGIETDDRGFITVDESLRTTNDSVWALGEVNARGAFTHTSFNDFEIVAANLLDDDSRRVSDRVPCYALFTDPPLGRVGMTEREVRDSGVKALIGTRPMNQVGRAREFGETQGFMKVLIDADSKLILGASILGLGGDEVVHSLLDLMLAREPYTVISRGMHIHPTVSELLPTVLKELEPLR